MTRIVAIFMGILLFIPFTSHAGILDIEITDVTTGDMKSFSFSSVEDLIDTMTEDFLEENFADYSEDDDINSTLNYRGLPIYLKYEGKALNIQIPATGLDKTFEGLDRDESQDELVDWLESEGEKELTRLMQALAAETANDPIAGNPNSLEAGMVASDFYEGSGIGSSPSRVGVKALAVRERPHR